MKALALDFDGVIAESAPEAFVVALETYSVLCPETDLRRRERDPLYAGFVERMPLGNRAEDFGIVLRSLEEAVPLETQADYDALRSRVSQTWMDEFHARFYGVRESLREGDPARWRSLLPPYPEFLELLQRRRHDRALAIATAKDRASVDALLVHYGVEALFRPELVLDKETGVNKSNHLRRLRERLDLPFHDITFVDDKVNHLDAVASLGVRCALAAWGYNGPREHQLARERGYLVCSLDDAESLLFD